MDILGLQKQSLPGTFISYQASSRRYPHCFGPPSTEEGLICAMNYCRLRMGWISLRIAGERRFAPWHARVPSLTGADGTCGHRATSNHFLHQTLTTFSGKHDRVGTCDLETKRSFTSMPDVASSSPCLQGRSSWRLTVRRDHSLPIPVTQQPPWSTCRACGSGRLTCPWLSRPGPCLWPLATALHPWAMLAVSASGSLHDAGFSVPPCQTSPLQWACACLRSSVGSCKMYVRGGRCLPSNSAHLCSSFDGWLDEWAFQTWMCLPVTWGPCSNADSELAGLPGAWEPAFLTSFQVMPLLLGHDYTWVACHQRTVSFPDLGDVGRSLYHSSHLNSRAFVRAQRQNVPREPHKLWCEGKMLMVIVLYII